jgi:hypothetical protein
MICRHGIIFGEREELRVLWGLVSSRISQLWFWEEDPKTQLRVFWNRGGSLRMHKTWWQWSGDQEKKKDCSCEREIEIHFGVNSANGQCNFSLHFCWGVSSPGTPGESWAASSFSLSPPLCLFSLSIISGFWMSWAFFVDCDQRSMIACCLCYWLMFLDHTLSLCAIPFCFSRWIHWKRITVQEHWRNHIHPSQW